MNALTFGIAPVLLLIIAVPAAVIGVIGIVLAICLRRKKSTQSYIPPVQQNAELCTSAEIPMPVENATASDISTETVKASNTLGETLKAHRIRCNMTQEYVAEALNVTRQAVSKWETDSSDPSTSNLLALAKLYGISAAELLKDCE